MKYLKYLIFIFILLIWYLRTWWHGLVMLIYTNPVIIQAVILTLILHYGVFKRLLKGKDLKIEEKGQEYFSVKWATVLSSFLLLVFVVLGLVVSFWFRGSELANITEYNFRDTLPESTANLRLMPYDVAERYAKDSLQLSQYKLGTENIVLIDENLSWVFPLVPDGLVLKFLRQNKGIVHIDATRQARNSQSVWQDLVIGEGMQIRDNLYWNILRERYFIRTDDPFYLIEGEDIYTVVGALSYNYKFRAGIFYTVPEFKGVFLVANDGDISFLSPAEAQAHPVLAGNRIYPEKLTRIQVEAYKYHLGIINRLFIHEDQIEIQDVRSVASTVNKQPYLMDTEEGLKWFISTEPFGASHGVFKIFVVDAITGKIELYELPEDQTLTGPVRAVDYVRRSNPIVDWDRFDSVEPLPFIRNQTLYWKLSVIPGDAAGIAYQAFVNSETNDVLELSLDEEVFAFLKGEEIAEILDETEDVGEIRERIREKIKEIEDLLEQLN